MGVDRINPRDFDTGGDQFRQSLLNFRYEFWIVSAYGNSILMQFREVIRREWKTRNPTRIDVKRNL